MLSLTRHSVFLKLPWITNAPAHRLLYNFDVIANGPDRRLALVVSKEVLGHPCHTVTFEVHDIDLSPTNDPSVVVNAVVCTFPRPGILGEKRTFQICILYRL